MGVKDRIRWEVQWHPASGARIRRLTITSRRFRRLFFTVGVTSWVIVAGGLLVGLDGFLTRSAFEAARRQNTALRAQQEALREPAFSLAMRLFEGVERERRMARLTDAPGRAREGQSLHLPPRNPGTEATLAWLSEQSMLLEALGNDLAAGRVDIGGKQASVRAPASTGTGPVRNAAVLQVADMGSATRQEAALARR